MGRSKFMLILFAVITVLIELGIMVTGIVIGEENGGRQLITMSSIVISLAILVCGAILIFARNDKEEDEEEGEEGEEKKQTSPKKTPPVYYYHDYMNGFSVVEKVVFDNEKHTSGRAWFSFVDKTGKLITSKWYDGVSDFNEWGVAIVMVNNEFNIIDKEGKEKCINWFKEMGDFSDGVVKVVWQDDTVNYINAEGEVLWPDWAPELASMREYYRTIKNNENSSHK